jgi:hypothetical protein
MNGETTQILLQKEITYTFYCARAAVIITIFGLVSTIPSDPGRLLHLVSSTMPAGEPQLSGAYKRNSTHYYSDGNIIFLGSTLSSEDLS